MQSKSEFLNINMDCAIIDNIIIKPLLLTQYS